MESNRIDKSQYKEAVQREKGRLWRQVTVLTILAAAIAGAFYGSLLSTNPYK